MEKIEYESVIELNNTTPDEERNLLDYLTAKKYSITYFNITRQDMQEGGEWINRTTFILSKMTPTEHQQMVGGMPNKLMNKIYEINYRRC